MTEVKYLKTLSLNTWALYVGFISSPDRPVRTRAIADISASSDWDIVCLQEVWNTDDFELIRKRVKEVLPESYYFHSGLVGSGVCIFTRGKITHSLMHRYSLNGYPHKQFHGDWFGGKVVGLVRVELNDLKIDVYGTHLHAEYDNDKDLYLSYRVLQAFELSQFVNAPTTGHLALVMGDLNLAPRTTGQELILSNASLSDAFVDRKSEATPDSHPNAFTSDVLSNSYSSKDAIFLTGERIDYVLSRGSRSHRVDCRTCYTTIGRISDRPDTNYSDHLGVCAKFAIRPASTDQEANQEKPKEALTIARRRAERSYSTEGVWHRCYPVEDDKLLCLLAPRHRHVHRFDRCTSCRARVSMMMLVVQFILTLGIGYCLVLGLVGVEESVASRPRRNDALEKDERRRAVNVEEQRKHCQR